MQCWPIGSRRGRGLKLGEKPLWFIRRLLLSEFQNKVYVTRHYSAVLEWDVSGWKLIQRIEKGVKCFCPYRRHNKTAVVWNTRSSPISRWDGVIWGPHCAGHVHKDVWEAIMAQWRIKILTLQMTSFKAITDARVVKWCKTSRACLESIVPCVFVVVHFCSHMLLLNNTNKD